MGASAHFHVFTLLVTGGGGGVACTCFPTLHKMPAVQIVSVQHPAEEEARVHPSDSLH